MFSRNSNVSTLRCRCFGGASFRIYFAFLALARGNVGSLKVAFCVFFAFLPMSTEVLFFTFMNVA